MKIEKTWIGEILNHIINNYLPYWNAVNTILMGYIGILFSINKSNYFLDFDSGTIGWILLLLSIISIIANVCLQNHNSKSLNEILEDKDDQILKLEREKNSLDLKIQITENKLAKINENSMEIVEIHLAYLFQKLSLTNNERITLYKFINDEFYVLGRYSMSNERSKRSRKSYKKEGLIFKAWNESFYFTNSGIPYPEEKNRTKFRKGYYKKLNEIATIDEETVWNMKMKSRSFYIKALKDLNGLGQTSIIVIESINDKAFEKSKIDYIFNEDEEKRLVAFVEKIDWDFQKISNASKIGF